MFEQLEETMCLISRIAEMLDIHPQTIRYYERLGLIKPARKRGNVRLYSKQDIKKLEQISTFTEMGVNLAGVEIILKLLDQVEQLKKEIENYRKHFAIQIRKETIDQ